MHAAARSYLTTGVALVGAGAIAISPVAPPIPTADTASPVVATSDLQLSALANPFVVYGQVVENTLENLGLLGERVIADPAPILAQILRNQWDSAQTLGAALDRAGQSLVTSFSPDNPFGVPALLRAAGEDLAAGDLAGTINTLWQVVITPLLGPAIELIPAITSVIRQPVQNMLDVIDQTQLPITLFAIGVLSPVYAGFVKAGGAFVQDLFDAARTGDLEGIVNAFITGPAAVINGFLNGDDVDAGFLSPGLGTISGLLNIRDAIAQALGRPAPTARVAAIDSTTTDAARTVSLSVESPEAGEGGAPASEPTPEPAVAEDDPTEAEDTAEDQAPEQEPAEEPVDEVTGDDEPLDDTTDEVTDEEVTDDEVTDDDEAGATPEDGGEDDPDATAPADSDASASPSDGKSAPESDTTA